STAAIPGPPRATAFPYTTLFRSGAEDLAPPTDDGAEGAGGDRNDDESAPSALPLTVLWPLAAPPTRVARIPGDHGTDPVVALSRSEEHTSELQSRFDLVCRLLLE